eukprot:9447444-Prorocentrum_lima.AAC.1
MTRPLRACVGEGRRCASAARLRAAARRTKGKTNLTEYARHPFIVRHGPLDRARAEDITLLLSGLKTPKQFSIGPVRSQ